MEKKYLHIVSFNVPFPPNYGGVIDVFYKIKSLYNNGVKIILHCFDYGRGLQPELEKYCEKVYYYQRKTTFINNLKSFPYIVVSRKNETLLQNLLLTDDPILFEGIHTCYYLNHPLLKKRFKVVRTHNIETEYYKNLAKQESSWWKKLYFEIESRKLKKYEQTIRFADLVLAVTEKDTAYFSKFCSKVNTIPVFHTNEHITIKPGKGDFVLYHGDLSSNENITAVTYLIDHVFSKISQSVIIAGMNPPKILKDKVKNLPNCQLISSPSIETINDLITNAQINILITFQQTGLKLKLLHALSSGRFCVVNSNMLHGTKLHPLCSIADTPQEMIREINNLFSQEFDNQKIIYRSQIFNQLHSNQFFTQQMIQLIFQ